jgi:membrane protease YdiL (CAAX protease family)
MIARALVLIEPLVLYAVLFLRIPQARQAVPEAIAFSVLRETARIMLYNVPALILIWHLLLKAKSLKDRGIVRPRLKDLLPAALALPGLALTGLAVSLVAPWFTTIPPAPRFLSPETIPSWIMLVISCLSTGYLEESFFRFYLLSKGEELGLGPGAAAMFSTLLFSFCHLYEGPWGFLNAALAGILLCFIFLRYRSLHGVACAHGLYNILVYALNALPE